MDAYFQSTFPEPFRILGLQLKPLSLGRYRLLRRFDCCFVSEKPEIPRPADLVLGIFICAHRCDEFEELLNRGEMAREISKWGKAIFGKGRHRFPHPFGWLNKIFKPRAFDYAQKVKLFASYLKQGIFIPEYWDKSSQTETSGAHWSQSIEIVLRGDLGWTSEEVDEAPMGKALSDYYKWLENKGMIQLVDSVEAERIAEEAEANSRAIMKN